MAQCLVNRGVASKAEVSEFLNPRLKLLADPYLIPNMDAAIERLWKARENNERLLIYGDYDVDGVSSTALLVEVLTELGWTVEPYLPGRFDDGYGLSDVSLEKCLEQFKADIVLAVDCGSTAVKAIEFLNDKKIDVLVLDHHQVSTPPPEPFAMVNPQLSDDYPNFQELCSVGLAFKLAHALVKRGRQEGLQKERDLDLKQYIDLVALGTVADLVPLTGENRTLVHSGLAVQPVYYWSGRHGNDAPPIEDNSVKWGLIRGSCHSYSDLKWTVWIKQPLAERSVINRHVGSA